MFPFANLGCRVRTPSDVRRYDRSSDAAGDASILWRGRPQRVEVAAGDCADRRVAENAGEETAAVQRRRPLINDRPHATMLYWL